MSTAITEVSGIGARTALGLKEHGIGSAEDLAAASVEALVAVPGFGPSRAAAVRETARALVSSRVREASEKAGQEERTLPAANKTKPAKKAKKAKKAKAGKRKGKSGRSGKKVKRAKPDKKGAKKPKGKKAGSKKAKKGKTAKKGKKAAKRK